MRRIISIGFLLLYMGTFTEFQEVLRLPILIGHFIEHRAQLPSMSFIQFMAMHYETDTPHDSTDMELPFKDCGNCMAVPAFALDNQKVFLPTGTSPEALVFFPTYISFVSSSGLSEIFQPPKA